MLPPPWCGGLHPRVMGGPLRRQPSTRHEGVLSRPTGGRLHHPQPRQSLPRWPLQIHLQLQGSADTSVFFSSNTQHPDLCGWPGAPSGSAGENCTWVGCCPPDCPSGGDRFLHPTSCHAPCTVFLCTQKHTHTPFQETGLLWPPSTLDQVSLTHPQGMWTLAPCPPVGVRRSL